MVKILWRSDIVEELNCPWEVVTCIFSQIGKYKFWGQNFYKWGRIVELVLESWGTLIILIFNFIHTIFMYTYYTRHVSCKSRNEVIETKFF